MEALVLAGGKAERLGDAAGGLPKPLVRVGGRPLAEYQVLRLVGAGVTRVIISCRAGHEQLFHETLSGLGAEIVAVGEPEPLGRGGGLRVRRRPARGGRARLRAERRRAPRRRPRARCSTRTARTPAPRPSSSRQVHSPFGVVDLADGDRVTGFREAPKLPHWVNSGVYVLDEEALARLPERGDHETSTFPELAAEGKLCAFRHEGTWLTVNTPKDLRRAEEFLAAHPDWQAAPA